MDAGIVEPRRRTFKEAQIATVHDGIVIVDYQFVVVVVAAPSFSATNATAG